MIGSSGGFRISYPSLETLEISVPLGPVLADCRSTTRRDQWPFPLHCGRPSGTFSMAVQAEQVSVSYPSGRLLRSETGRWITKTVNVSSGAKG